MPTALSAASSTTLRPSMAGRQSGGSGSRRREAPRRSRAAMRAVNPAFIPRNHRVEAAIAAAQNGSDFTLLDELLTALAAPYDDRPEFAQYADPPRTDRPSGARDV